MFQFLIDLKNRIVAGCLWISDRMGLDREARERRRLEREIANSQARLMREFGLSYVVKGGEGTFGTVYFGTVGDTARMKLHSYFLLPRDTVNEMSQQEVAVKVFWNVRERSIVREYYREVNTVKKLRHPNIIRHFVDFQVYENELEFEHNQKFRRLSDPLTQPGNLGSIHFVLVMERLGEDMAEAKEKLKLTVLNELEISHWFVCVGSALTYLHRQGLTHEDLSLQNIVFARPILRREEFTEIPIKLIDFGGVQAFTPAVYERARLRGEEGLKLWENEERHLQIERFVNPRRSNPFTSEAYFFARMLMCQSTREHQNFPRIFDPNLPSTFCAGTSVKNPQLRKALLLMAVNDERVRLTIEQGLQIYN